jgi:hypothetical protein
LVRKRMNSAYPVCKWCETREECTALCTHNSCAFFFFFWTYRTLRLLAFNLLNSRLNPVCHLLALLETHHILHVSRIRVKMPNMQTNMTSFSPGSNCSLPFLHATYLNRLRFFFLRRIVGHKYWSGIRLHVLASL